jgi:rhodanese-related sulfurtransferase
VRPFFTPLKVGGADSLSTEGNTAAILSETASETPEISREELRERLSDPTLTIVDVLPESSYVEWHIPGALSLPLELIASRARELLQDRAADIVLYCGNTECGRSLNTAQQLHELGYSKVRLYRGGLADWMDSGQPTESVADAPPEPDSLVTDSSATLLEGPPLTISPSGEVGRVPARLSQMRRWDRSVLSLIHRRSALQLFFIWIAMILLSGVGYWLVAMLTTRGLVEAGHPVGTDLKGFGTALYFSFVTATSIGYGDILPVGIARLIAVAEAISALLIFGSVVAKFVSHRQDELVAEIHRITFEERLDRVQTNLHMVISDMLAITAMCEAQKPPNRIATRLESAVRIFNGEIRAIHDLLYQRKLVVEERVLAAILANLYSALNVLSELLQSLPPTFVRSQLLTIVLDELTRLAGEICASCVPHEYTPRLVFWMDRIESIAQRIK